MELVVLLVGVLLVSVIVFGSVVPALVLRILVMCVPVLLPVAVLNLVALLQQLWMPEEAVEVVEFLADVVMLRWRSQCWSRTIEHVLFAILLNLILLRVVLPWYAPHALHARGRHNKRCSRRSPRTSQASLCIAMGRHAISPKGAS